MAEGGLLPWKRQNLKIAKSADYSDIQKPLPNPPDGFEWKRSENKKDWSLVSNNPSLSASHDQKGLKSEESESQRLHKVLPTDTIQGLCLKYKVSPNQLRKENNFTGDNLFSAPEILVIPYNGKSDGCILKDSDDKNTKISKFLIAFSVTSDKSFSRQEAIAYLDINDWDVSLAIHDAKEGLHFENS